MGHLVRLLPHGQPRALGQVARDLAERIKLVKVDMNKIHGSVGDFEVQAVPTPLVRLDQGETLAGKDVRGTRARPAFVGRAGDGGRRTTAGG